MNFGILVRAEPELLVLLIEILAKDRDLSFKQKNDLWYKKGFKSRMELLVGCMRQDKDERLTSSAAYDCAYETLYGALTGEALR